MTLCHWFQESIYDRYRDDEETGGSFAAKHYDAKEGWAAYV